jgi:hypothetical protein
MEGQDMSDSFSDDVAQDYVCRLFDDVKDWYKNADFKAQILLTLDGVFLAFLMSMMTMKKEDLDKIVAQFNFYTWGFLALTAACLTLTIILAIRCLWARILSQKVIDRNLAQLERESMDRKIYLSKKMWYFQYISQYETEEFQEDLLEVDKELKIRAMGSQIRWTSKEAVKKYRSINYAFLFAGLSLIFFLATGVSYIAAIAG